MTDALFLADFGQPQVGDVVTVGGSEGRHAAVVKRVRTGEQVLVADGQGHAVAGPVVGVGKDQIDVQVEQVLAEPSRSRRWCVVQALAKGDRGEQAIDMLTELGVDEIWAWQAHRCVSRWDGKVDKGLAKWRSTVREATKQSRRFTVPQVGYVTTGQVGQLLAQADLGIVFHEDATSSLRSFTIPAGRVVFVIGPEGSISPQEMACFTQAGAVVASLGEHVLRTSTAGTVALAQLQALAGG